MKLFLPVLFALLFSLNGICQNFDFRMKNLPKFLNSNGDTLINAFAGGLEAPQFSAIDLNNDAIKDLFIFDRRGGKILTFINKGTPGQVSYTYAPQYEDFFPKLHNWVLLVDYNYDGKEDIFTLGSSGIRVFKNTSTATTLSFILMSEQLDDRISTFNIYTSNEAIPAVTDIDNDGDIDILAFGILGGWVEFSRSLSKDLNLPPDSLLFESVDLCWGSFEELSNSHNANLGINCSSSKFYKDAAHSGSTLLAIDMDNDGDKDMIHGSVAFNDLILFKNGKTDHAWPIDTMVQIDTIFPMNTKQAYITTFPAAFYIDVNNDGKRDLLVAPNDKEISKNINQVFYYRNTGTDLAPIFTFEKDNFLQDQMIDEGSSVAPAFFDYDLDGDNDLFLGVHGNFLYTNNFKDRIILYKNVGSPAYPVYQAIDTNYLSLAANNLSGITPTFGDMNGDGKKDLLFGDHTGVVYYYQNQGGTPNTFLLIGTVSDNNGVLDVGTYSAPQLIDLDRDGKLDLVIGEYEGNINYYRNTGSAVSPTFVLLDDSLGKINVKDSVVQYDYDTQGNIIDSFYIYEQDGFAGPYITDLDGDGDYDMIAGANYGRIICYTNIDGNLSGTFSRNDKIIYDQQSGTFISKYFGQRTMVIAEDLNADGKPDILVGNYRGGLSAVIQADSVTGISTPEPATAQFSVYPNPASGLVHITSNSGNENISVRIYSLLGQLVLSANYEGQGIDISPLKEGMYILEISDGKHAKSSSRLAVIKP
jgi:hypothetical protein